MCNLGPLLCMRLRVLSTMKCTRAVVFFFKVYYYKGVALRELARKHERACKTYGSCALARACARCRIPNFLGFQAVVDSWLVFECLVWFFLKPFFKKNIQPLILLFLKTEESF